jgi:hypothetical protein
MDCDHSGCKTERAFKALFAIFPLGVFLVSSYLAWRDQSWGALSIAIIYSPVANLLLMLLGAFAAFIVQQLNPGTRLGSMMSWVLGLPPFVAFATGLVVFMMGLHGC